MERRWSIDIKKRPTGESANRTGDSPEGFSADDKPEVSSDEPKEVSDRLMSVAQAQQEQADTIAKMAEQIGAHYRTPSGNDDGDKMGGPCVDVEKKESIGEAKELT